VAYRERKTGVESSRDDLNSTPVLIGFNREGRWVVYDPLGIRGGLFSNRADALRFATSHHGRPQVALLVPHWIEFDAGRPNTQTNQAAVDAPTAIPLSVPEDRWIGFGGRRGS
jgi:hypothetical protein